jgi:chromate reductase, NAD(P)H dehydrogenase (quinone)
MDSFHDVAVFVGSLRKASLCRRLAQELARLAPSGFAFDIVPIGDLPIYNPDIEEQGGSEAWNALRHRAKRASAFLFITPEYNRSVPAALKNALDVGSRPYGKSVWAGKPGAVISLSPGALGGFGANHHLRQILSSVGVATMAQPEMYISAADKLFDAEGHIANSATEEFLRGSMASFGQWIGMMAAA